MGVLGPDTLPIFGLDVFRNAPSTFEPTLAGGVGSDYRVGPGDVLALLITGDTERTYSLEVSREGFILIPTVGQVFVANLTLREVQDLLFSRLKQFYSGLSRSPNGSTRLYVTVARLHTNQVFVIGEVIAPGNYRVSSVGTVLTALYAAGGPNNNGTLRRVQVRRGAQVVSTIDLYNYLVRGDASQDVRLESGDVVFVGVQGGRVSIKGQIARPAIYELLPGETLADLISTAGGFTTEALQQRVQVRRVLPADQREAGGRDRVVLDVLPSQFAAGTGAGFVLVPGDRVEVFPINGVERNAIVVAGNVWTSGTQGYKPGMTLSQAIQAAGGVKPDVYLDQVLVSRLEPDGVRHSLHASFADSLGTLTQNLPLQEGDSVYIYSRTEFSPKRYVAITGAVMHGGQYDYRRGMTLRELMLLAGGPLESADLREAEIARFPSNRAEGVLAQTFRVPLDSSYLFEKSPYANYLGRPGVDLPGQKAPEVELQPYDNVLIFRQPMWHMLGEVAVTGEVRYPGSYTLTKAGEKLSELIARAGGLTTNADPEGLVFYRKADSAGRIGVDLPQVLRNSRSPENIALVPGDSIAIGAHKPYVRVAGAVNSPIAVAYVKGAALDYYISAAGGPTQLADVGRAYVRQPNGDVESRVHRWLLPDRDVVPKAGATVVVPAKDPNQKPDLAAIATALTPIIVATLSAIALIVHH